MADSAVRNLQPIYCKFCEKYFSSSRILCEHVVMLEHVMKVKVLDPDSLPHLYKLQYFFDTYLPLEPLVGLEYIDEMQDVNGFYYKYRCRLCSFHGYRQQAFQHITVSNHVTKYLAKHHSKISVLSCRYRRRLDFRNAINKSVTTVFEKFGRKTITEITAGDTPTPENVAKSSSDPQTGTATAPDTSGDIDTRSPGEREDDGCQAELSEFKGNGDFLDYLQKFRIQNDEDAMIVKQITQNCIQALLRFREELVQQNEQRGMGAGGQRTGL